MGAKDPTRASTLSPPSHEASVGLRPRGTGERALGPCPGRSMYVSGFADQGGDASFQNRPNPDCRTPNPSVPTRSSDWSLWRGCCSPNCAFCCRHEGKEIITVPSCLFYAEWLVACGKHHGPAHALEVRCHQALRRAVSPLEEVIVDRRGELGAFVAHASQRLVERDPMPVHVHISDSPVNLEQETSSAVCLKGSRRAMAFHYSWPLEDIRRALAPEYETGA